MSVKQNNLKTWFKSGTPWIWMNAGAVSIAVIMTLGLMMVIAVRGLGHFWPADIVEADYQIPGQEAREVFKVGNRDVYGGDFTWVVGEWLSNLRSPGNPPGLGPR